MSSIKELKDLENFELGRFLQFPNLKCIICNGKPTLPYMLKTECEHFQFICQDCTIRLNQDFSWIKHCTVCKKSCITDWYYNLVLEFQDLLCKFNDWRIDTQGVGFLDATCKKCIVDFVYQQDIMSHNREGHHIMPSDTIPRESDVVCSRSHRTAPLYSKSEEFDMTCIVCHDQVALPTKVNTSCNCKTSIACLSCTRAVLQHGARNCMGCRSPIIIRRPLSLMYSKQRGFQLLDDWFKKYGKKHYCNSACPHCGVDFGSQAGLFKHMISLCPQSPERRERNR